jgi:predicted secreted protein
MKALFFLTLLGGLACSQSIPTQKKDPIVVTTCDTMVTMRPNESLTIQLPAQIGTGFRWDVGTQTDPSVLLPPSEEVVTQTGTDDRDGRAEVQVIKLTAANKTGTNTVTLKYHRPFDKTTPPAKTCAVTIVVKN